VPAPRAGGAQRRADRRQHGAVGAVAGGVRGAGAAAAGGGVGGRSPGSGPTSHVQSPTSARLQPCRSRPFSGGEGGPGVRAWDFGRGTWDVEVWRDDAVAAGAQFLVNLTDDGWFGDTALPAQHLQATVLRAVEARRWRVRASNSGISAIIDPTGEVVPARLRARGGRSARRL